MASKGPETMSPPSKPPKLKSLLNGVYHLLGADPVKGETDIGPNTIFYANVGLPKPDPKRPEVLKPVVPEDRAVGGQFVTENGQVATVLAVGDGIGGEVGGEVAAEQFAEAVIRSHSYADVEARTIAGLKAKAQQNPELNKSGVCTAVATIVGDTLYKNRRGDARIYVFSKDGVLKSLTRDENIYYATRPAADARSTEREAMLHRTESSSYDGILRRNDMVINDLSIVKECQPEDELKPEQLEKGDVVFVCSDGVSDNATAPEIWKLLTSGDPTLFARAIRYKMGSGDFPASLNFSPPEQGGSKDIPGKSDNFSYAAYVHGKTPAWWPKPKSKLDVMINAFSQLLRAASQFHPKVR